VTTTIHTISYTAAERASLRHFARTMGTRGRRVHVGGVEQSTGTLVERMLAADELAAAGEFDAYLADIRETEGNEPTAADVVMWFECAVLA
jgi:hypothetical protein